MVECHSEKEREISLVVWIVYEILPLLFASFIKKVEEIEFFSLFRRLLFKVSLAIVLFQC